MTTLFLRAAICASAASLAWDWFGARNSIATALVVVIAAAWLIAEARRVRWAANFGLLSVTGNAITAHALGLSPTWALAGLAFALAAWDLSDFKHRLDFGAQPEDRAVLERNHLTRLGIILAIGLALSEITLRVTTVRVSFEWIMVLICVGAGGLMALIGWLRERGG